MIKVASNDGMVIEGWDNSTVARLQYTRWDAKWSGLVYPLASVIGDMLPFAKRFMSLTTVVVEVGHIENGNFVLDWLYGDDATLLV